MIVYCVSRKPERQHVEPDTCCRGKPELLKRSVKTNSADAWWSGTKIRTSRITATPMTCHHTEMPLMRATRWLPAMFTRAWKARMTTKSQNVPREEVARDAVEQVEVEGAEGDVHERGAAVVDRGGDRDEPDEVEPAGEPAPGGAAELGRPPVDAARGRIGRHELGHAEADDQDGDRDQRPAPGDRDRPAVVPRLPVGGEAPGQDRDDRERDREVLKAAPAAVELLLVAELGEPLLVAIAGARYRVLTAMTPSS